MKVDKLIVNYLEERDNKSFEDIDIINLHTAFNMPSIILVSSPKLWKFISEHYFNLCESVIISVRVSIAASFHEVFKILYGCQLTSKFEKQMIDIFTRYTKDIDEIKARILDNVDIFLPLISQKDSMFTILMNLFDAQDSWRVQQAKAKLIKTISENYSIDKLISNMVMSKWEKLIENNNYSVQRTAAENFSAYLQRIIHKGNQISKVACVGYIQKFKSSINYKDRMLFIHMTHRIIRESSKLFEQNFSSDYVDLSTDKIANVKILMAKILQGYQDCISSINDLDEAEANLQNSGIKEIEALYSEVERKKQTMLELRYDCYYLNFINNPDPALFAYMNKKIDLTNPDLLMDKSEDALLKCNDKQSSGVKMIPINSKTSGASALGGFQEFDSFVEKVESKKSSKK